MTAATEPGAQQLLAVFGGTFNPIHHGHLRSALELVDALSLDHVRLMPSALPPHRELPEGTAEQRATMVELAIDGEPSLVCDRRELAREGASYTIDSLCELRSELSERVTICLVVGADAFRNINNWYKWKSLLDYAHLIVIARPGWRLPKRGKVAKWLAKHQIHDREELKARSSGGILVLKLRLLPIASSEIRAHLQMGKSVRYLLPQSVLDYIEQQQLYISEDNVPDLNQPHSG